MSNPVAQPLLATTLGLVSRFSTNKSNTTITGNKVVPAGTCVRNNASLLSFGVEDDAIRSWTAARVGFVAAQDREFLVWAANAKVEALVVVVRVRIVAWSIAVLVVAVACADGIVDVALVVAGVAAGYCAVVTFARYDVVRVYWSAEFSWI